MGRPSASVIDMSAKEVFQFSFVGAEVGKGLFYVDKCAGQGRRGLSELTYVAL